MKSWTVALGLTVFPIIFGSSLYSKNGLKKFRRRQQKMGAACLPSRIEALMVIMETSGETVMQSGWVLGGFFAVILSGLTGAAQAAGPDPVLEQGRKIYQERCQACHEGEVKKAPHRTMLQMMLPASIARALKSGVMISQGEGLTADDRAAVAAFITGTTGPVAMHEPPRCKAGKAWFDKKALPDAVAWGFDRGDSRYIPAKVGGVEAGDLSRLRLKWVFAYPGAVRVRSQPVTAGGALFAGSHDGTVYALDQKTGCIHWTFEAATEVRTSLVIRPWRTAEGKKQESLMYFGDLVGNVYAIHTETGKLAWRFKPSNHHSATITATPALYNDRLYVAVSSLEVTAAADPAYECCSFRGMLTALDALTGKQIWASETIPEPLVVTGRNSRGTTQYGPSGAPIWGAPVVDTVRRRIYVGTGENYSVPATGTSDAILAFDLDSGKMQWSYQATAGDVWNMGCEVEDKANCPAVRGPDFDFGAGLILAKSNDGRDVILAGQKSGSLFALDPDHDGALLWTRKVGRGGIQGGIHFGMATGNGTVFVPVSDFADGHTYDFPARPGMHAFDIATGKPLWSTIAEDTCGDRKFCGPGISAAPTAIPGAVLAGAMDGILRAYDAATGAVLWSIDTAKDFPALGGATAHGGSMGGAAGPIFKDGMMFVNSGYGIYFHMPGNALMAFELAPARKASKKN
jgi:polyvinyl alcohol dehydrogenase (cytochrome)